MSRSYKKNCFCTDNGERKRFGKRQANKLIRRTSGIADGMSYKKYYCSWDICDYKFHRTWEDFKKEPTHWEKFVYTFEGNKLKKWTKIILSENEVYRKWYKMFKMK